MLPTHCGTQQGSPLIEWISDLRCWRYIEGILAQIEYAQLTRLATAFQGYFIKERKYKLMNTWLASER